MHQPYTAPTLNSTRPAYGIHRYTRQSSHHKPIHQRHSPPNLHANPATTNQSTNDTVHQISTPIQPPQTNPPTTQSTHYRYHHTHSTNTTTIQPHKHIQPPQPPQTAHTRRRAGPTLTQSMHSTLTPLHRRSARLKRAYSPAFRPDTHSASTDAVAAPMQAQQPQHQSAIRQARQTGSGHTKPDRTGSGHPFTIEQARYQTGRVQNQTEPDQAMTCAQARNQTGHDLTGHCQTGRIQDQAIQNQTRQDQIRPGQAIGFAFDETSRPASANFSAKPDSTLLRNASRAGAVVGVDVV